MATLRSWFSVLRWSLIITLILLILISTLPLIFPRHFVKEEFSSYYLINGAVTTGLCVFGLCAICCYFFWLVLLFAICMSAYLLVEIFYLGGNIGVFMTTLGIIVCSFTYCAILKRFEREEKGLYY